MSKLPSSEILFEEAACGLLITDFNGIILKANKTFCQWLDYDSVELVGNKRLQDLFTIGGRFFHHTHWAPLLQIQGSVAEVQMDMVRKDGSNIHTLINARRHQLEESGYTELAIFIATDRKKYERELLRARQQAEQSVADLRRLQDELQQLNEKLSEADRRKDEFLATLAHELRNPLAPITNVLQILKIKEPDEAQFSWARDIIDRQIGQMTHLIDDLMDVSRITQGRLTLRKEILGLRSILLQSIESSRNLVDTAGHELLLEMPEIDIALHGDTTRLVQIFSNLINNAAKYTPPGGKISISVNLIKDSVEIIVSDSGIGIAPAKLNSVFDMFSQLTPALERAQGGLGIGLALVRGLVELHEGNIHALSDGEGKGSRFVLTFPVHASGLTASIPSTTPMIECDSRHKVLIVDDNIDAAQSLSTLLNLLNYQTQTAYTGNDGITIGAQFLPRVMILDIGLPDISGYEVAKHIRSTHWGKNILLVAATGWGQDKDKELAVESGFDSHLTKPIDFGKLHNILELLEA